ncbi:MAG: hypothetical protein WCI74_14110, partial [Actinomycetes bacterium]
MGTKTTGRLGRKGSAFALTAGALVVVSAVATAGPALATESVAKPTLKVARAGVADNDLVVSWSAVAGATGYR